MSASRRFQFSLATDAVIDSIARQVANSEAVMTTLRETIAEQLAAHQEAAAVIDAYESETRDCASAVPPSPPQLPTAGTP